MQTIEGKLDAQNLKVAIIVSRFNSFISEQLVNGAMDCLNRHHIKENNIVLIKVPGSFELPLTAKKLAQTKKFDAIIALGVIIRGDTPHFDFVANETTKGLAQVSLNENIPISFGVLTTENLEQAINRAGTKSGNKGWDAALTAIEMVNLFKSII
ncbi:MAG: 6,7-dimethyl-8-ribityllumazine synthase [Candidatus Margulisiibacteriota bacterium]|jgi:6,7-dimethyl-8-ribityllumazine synthase